MSSRILKTKEKIVAVRNFNGVHKLCAFDPQNHDKNNCTVTFKERKDDKNETWTAFMFRIEQDRLNYVLQANESNLEIKLVPLNQLDEVDGNLKSYWFKRDSAALGDYYSVRAMVSPDHYLCIDNSRMELFFLSDVADRAKVKDEAV